MPAANSDHYKKLAKRWVSQIGAGGVNDASVTTVPLASTTNLPADTAVVATIDRVDVNGTATPALEEAVVGVVSGSNLVSCLRGQEGTAQAHSAGAVVEILVTAKGLNDIIDGFLVAHSQLGVHKTSAVFTTPILNKPVINGTDPTGATYTPATGSQTVALDCAANNLHIVTGHASGTAITFTIANATNNQPFIVSILQGGVVSTIAAWFATIRWAGGSAPTLTATINKRDTFGFIRTGVNTYDGFIIGQNA
jgi:hypothetical protein